jgi:hypothetical protein
MVRRREHHDAMYHLRRQNPGRDGCAKDDPAHGVRDDVDAAGSASRQLQHAVTNLLGECLDGCSPRRIAEVVDLIATSRSFTGYGPQ